MRAVACSEEQLLWKIERLKRTLEEEQGFFTEEEVEEELAKI